MAGHGEEVNVTAYKQVGARARWTLGFANPVTFISSAAPTTTTQERIADDKQRVVLRNSKLPSEMQRGGAGFDFVFSEDEGDGGAVDPEQVFEMTKGETPRDPIDWTLEAST